MPGIAKKINSSDGSNETSSNYPNTLTGNGTLPYNSFNGSSVSNNGFWSKHRDEMSYDQLQTFWSELTPQARQKLMRIDKQTLFEHARKNMYCSRCNGLLLEGFLQIVIYGKSLQPDATSGLYNGRAANNQNYGNLCMDNGCEDDVVDPSVHPWGGITTAKDGTLTLLDCYLYSKSLRGLQNVFDSARARERERKLLYPDACGGGGRGWISQGMAGYGRVHGMRESCALHTARLSVETLVDFWSALGDETRQSLLKMKEEDFIDRLMYRFDSKRFCRDCRRNVIREFKELKELKRMRKDPRCTSWFCVADTAFQYEVSHDTVRADWRQTYVDACGTYHHFEWAIGTGEGKSDILEFENVGLSSRVEVNGLELCGLNACYITLRAWKRDGRCNEKCVKAHALRGEQCVHCRLVVGDGYVTITTGERIRKFFEHAEEAEEEEDDDSMDKDGNELDGECSRPQKHAKSPELAREFLLDAATVIFKEQVEKAFREGTARQNAHSIFVCLALKLLEERVLVACKEIITLEKQMKLLEEEEKEKREEVERKERKRIKEREKKMRRKERLKEKENKERKCADSNRDLMVLDTSKKATACVDENANVGATDCATRIGEATPVNQMSPNNQDDQIFVGRSCPNTKNHSEDTLDGESGNARDFNTSLPYNQMTYSRRKLRFHRDTHQDLTLEWSNRRNNATLSENELVASKYKSGSNVDGFESTQSISGFDKQLRTNASKSNTRNGPKLTEKLQCANSRTGVKCNSPVCSCNHLKEYRSMRESHIMGSNRVPKYVNKLESSDISKPYYRGKCTQVECTREINGHAKCNTNARNPPVIKKVWEPLDSQKNYTQSTSGSVVALRLAPKVDVSRSDQVPELSGTAGPNDMTDSSVEINEVSDMRDLTRSSTDNCRETENGFHSMEKSQNFLNMVRVDDGELCSIARSPHRMVDSSLSSSFNSDNCSSCLSEGDSNTSFSNPQNLESTSTSDSEESSETSEERSSSHNLDSRLAECHKVVNDQSTLRGQDAKSREPASGGTSSLSSVSTEAAVYCERGRAKVSVNAQLQSMLPHMHNQNIQYPLFQAPTMGYYHQSPVSWPASPNNGLMSFPYSNHYLFTNGFGYDLNNNAQFMQYGALQPLPPPLINHVHMPVFPPEAQASGVGTKDHAKVVNLGVLKEVHDGIQKVALTKQHFAEAPKVGHGGKSDKVDEENNDFSLFHFGGPVALSTGFKAEPVSSKEGTMSDDTYLNLSENSPEGNHPCNRKDDIEEYSLFAASNAIKFSIF